MRSDCISKSFGTSLRAMFIVILYCALPFQLVNAGAGDPISLTATGSGLEVETMWNFRIAVGEPDASAIRDEASTVHAPDFVLTDGEASSNSRKAEAGKSWTVQRKPDQTEVSVVDGTAADLTANDVVVSCGDKGTVAVIADGVAILNLTAVPALADLTKSDLPEMAGENVIVPVLSASSVGETTTDSLNNLLGPDAIHRVVCTADRGEPLVKAVAATVFSGSEIDVCSHNRTAISTKDGDRTEARITLLGTGYYELNEERAKLFQIKETACSEAQKTYAKLSADQLNFKPANGTHTPRWNAEHLMGRELVFFSQIMAEVDSSIVPINLNPKQMPPEYEAAHPDWSGVEEAAQMQRVSAFTRRFAYLLHDVPMDQRAPGSGWTLRRLLMVMPQHYASHTSNVEKKFELEGFPSE